MPRLSEVSADVATTLLLYGNSGTGKTWMIGTAGDRTLIISPSNGIATLKSALFKTQINANPFIEEVNEEPIPTKALGYDLYSDIIDRYLKDHAGDIDTIIVDDATAFRRTAMNKGLELNQAANRSKTKSQSKDVIIPTVQDYGIEMNLVEQFCRYYTAECKRLNKNFVLTAHERIVYQPPDKLGDLPVIHKIQPAFTGKTFPDDITGLFDLTWHTETKGSGDRIFYQIRTQPDSSVIAKTRWGGLFPVLIEKQIPLTLVFSSIRSQTPIPKGK